MNSDTSAAAKMMAIILVLLLVSLFLTIGWNLGIAAALTAAGVQTGTISIFQGMGLTAFLLGLVTLFRGGSKS